VNNDDHVLTARARDAWEGVRAEDNGKEPEHDGAHGAAMRRLSDIEPEPVEWLWNGRIALGRLTLIAGDPGLGKSLSTTDLAARCTTGRAWPDDEPNLLGPRGVVIASAEDSASDTIRPRFDAAGGDPCNVMILDGVRRFTDSGPVVTPWSIDDGAVLREAISAATDCALLIVDPISAYMPAGLDSHRNADVRGALQVLSDIAEETGVAVVAVTHLRKGEGAAIYRAMGSLAFVAAARSAFGVVRDPDDETGETRLLAPIKNNLAPLGTTIPFTTVKSDEALAPVVAWGAPRDCDIDAAMSARPGGGERAPARSEAADWLAELLADDPVLVKDIRSESKEAGISWRTVERAKGEVGAVSMKRSFNTGWCWTIPGIALTRSGDAPDEDRQAGDESTKTANSEELGGLRPETPQTPHLEPVDAKAANSASVGGLRHGDGVNGGGGEADPCPF